MSRGAGPTLSGWGRQAVPGRQILSEDLERVTAGAVLTRGLGRAYGDSALPPPGVLEVAGSTLADRILSLDAECAVVRAEAGLSLAALLRVLAPRRLWSPVVPGTQYVTLGGMVAADIHGKNHHVAGTIGRHVRALRVRLAEGAIVECSRELEPELFRATLGGMGLTGHVLEVELALERIPSPWILTETRRVRNIDEYLRALQEEAARWPLTVGWIDCLKRGPALGRGLLQCGRWATAEEAPRHAPRAKGRLPMPFVLPSWVLSGPSVRAFNAALYRVVRTGRRLVSPEQFFFPLDSIRNWNRMYGKRGMTQFQCVLPEKSRPGATRRFLEVMTAAGGASFLCVIKDCGDQGEGLLSFPMPGVSVAVDLPVRRDTQRVIDALATATIAEGGRVYLAKDGFVRREDFARLEPRLAEFTRARRRFDPAGRLRSAQSARLLDEGGARA
jgi:FAD/FMN-containing dehydrogenase